VETALTATLSSPAQASAEGIAEDRFDEIVHLHQRRVYRVIFLLLKDSEAADTLTQECFLRAYRKRASFRGESSVATWLLQIAVNLARDHGKSRRLAFWRRTVGLVEGTETSPAHYLAAPGPSPEQILLAREMLKRVWDAAAGLPPQQRTIFLLRFAEEMPLAEIAQVLDLQTGTVKAHLFRAISKVKQTVKGTSCS
jgi:RNA polymerase sigma-70 factor (ECF subfamily)